MSKKSNAVRKTEAAPIETQGEVTNSNPVEVFEQGKEPQVQAQTTEASTAPVSQETSTLVAAVTETPEQLIAKYGNKSNAIRAMAAAGMKCGPISKALNIRYQHARNVLNQPLKRVIKEEREAAKATAPAPTAPATETA